MSLQKVHSGYVEGSSDWDSTYTTVSAKSVNWDAVHTFVVTDSATNNSVFNQTEYVNVTGGTVTGDLTVNATVSANELNITNPIVPVSASSVGTPGDFAWDTNYTYICVATNTWKRSLLSGGW